MGKKGIASSWVSEQWTIVKLSDMENTTIVDDFWYEKDLHLAPSKIPLDDVDVNLTHFQNRKKPYSEFSVQSLLQAVLSGDFDSRILDRDIFWRDTATNKKFILAWHSRHEAFKRLRDICLDPMKKIELESLYSQRPKILSFLYGYDWFQKIPAIILDDIRFDKAKHVSLMSNALATVEMDSERAEIYRSFRALWKTPKEIDDFWRRCEKSNRPKIKAYSFLNPNGKILDLVDAFECNQDDSVIIKRIAKWVWDIRMKESDLSDIHENELFDWLYHKSGYGTRKGQINAYPKFQEIVSKHVWRMRELGTLSSTQILNILNLQSLSFTMRKYYSLLDQLQEKKRKLYTEFHDTRRRINASAVASWTDTDIQSLMDDLAEKISVPIDFLRKIEKTENVLFSIKDSIDERHAEKILREVMDHINRLEQEYYKLKNKKNSVLQESQKELSLDFSK